MRGDDRMKYDDPTRATDEALAKAFGDIANELAQRGSDAYPLAFKATRDAALDDLLAHLAHLAEVLASIPMASGRLM
jgi:hypothetical protein